MPNANGSSQTHTTSQAEDEQAPARRGAGKEKYWRQQIAQQRKSGLSQARYCQKHGLNPNNFSWWIREIRERDKVNAMEMLGAEFRALHEEVAREEENPFVAVNVVGSEPPVVEGFLDVVLPSGAVIRVTEKTPMNLLARVLKKLEGE